MAVSAVADVITELIQSYHELNPQFVDELLEEPSPLEFMRYVAAKRPFVIRGGCSQWPATESWSAAYLVHRMEDRLINVAITPSGYV
jgi:peptidyl-lysine (3S)-dioxygenase / protease